MIRMTKTFAGLLEYFVLTYAPKEAGFSPQTVRSYYTALEQYALWIRATEGISMEDVNVSHFDKERIRRFLLYLETEENVSVSTRNLRRAAILSFLGFAQQVCPLYANAYAQAKTIKVKKNPGSDKSFLTVEEYKAMLESVDIASYNGLNHYLMLTILYDTAARVDEAVRLNFEDFSFGRENTVTIFGKGSKYRRVFLSEECVKVLQGYMKRTGRSSGPLLLNKNGDRVSDSGIDYVLKKYAALATEKVPSLKRKRVSPHTMRRSRATHMLLNGISIAAIQRILGHSSIKTTQAYLDAGSEAMAKAVQKSEDCLKESGVIRPDITDWHDEDILRRLKRVISRRIITS